MVEVNPQNFLPTSDKISIYRKHWDKMREHVHSQLPLEACGLVAGQRGYSKEVFPIINNLSSPVRFRMDPEQQIRVFLHFDEIGWDLLAIYHSHPQGPATPSPTDIAESAYPDTVSLIWARPGGEWACRGFEINHGEYREVFINIVEEEQL